MIREFQKDRNLKLPRILLAGGNCECVESSGNHLLNSCNGREVTARNSAQYSRRQEREADLFVMAKTRRQLGVCKPVTGIVKFLSKAIALPELGRQLLMSIDRLSLPLLSLNPDAEIFSLRGWNPSRGELARGKCLSAKRRVGDKEIDPVSYAMPPVGMERLGMFQRR